MINEVYKFEIIEKCKRCEDEKSVNRHGLCKSCQDEVDYEYSLLYRIKTMED
ncbi:MAG: hypothetical protein KAH05_08215 [Clostridiales bacterium]|jgi:hypothetical protein|nr:hypothetical protein [Clostridiales bacterium]MEA3423255.1 hypothetical protein [Bacillota bacterium]